MNDYTFQDQMVYEMQCQAGNGTHNTGPPTREVMAGRVV